MNKHLSAVMGAVLAIAVLLTIPAFAGHRPANVVVSATVSLSGCYAEPRGRQMNAVKRYVRN